MNTNPANEELIDLYLKDELSAADKQSFEAQMQADAALTKEVAFQKQLVNGVSAYRKAQLKARLDLIEVAPSPISIIGQSAYWKIAGSVVVASLIATGIYFTWDSEPKESISQIEISSQVNLPESITVPVVPNVIEPVSERQTVDKQSTTKKIESVVEKITKDPAPTSRTENVFVPKVNAPDPDEVADRALATDLASLPEMAASDVVNKVSKPIDVKTIEEEGLEITYKYYEGKLFLYGDFNKEPYEILEINSKTDRTIYLYFKEQYFQIEATTEVKPLRSLSNASVINDLNIIRSNKTE